MLNSRLENLNVILGMYNPLKDVKGIGYTVEWSNQKIVFIFPIHKEKINMLGKMSQNILTFYHTHLGVSILWST